jgi:diguanylate cyclase (GGDEF)-like protein/PAS domain S-box-containing protein
MSNISSRARQHPGSIRTRLAAISLLAIAPLAVVLVVSAAPEHKYAALALAASAAALAIGVTYGASHRWLVLPHRRMAGVVRDIGRGNLDQRIDIAPIKVGELHALANDINVMAQAIAESHRQLRDVHTALARTAEDYRTLAENATDLMVRFDASMKRVYISPACMRLYGYDPAELLGQTPRSIVHPDDWALAETSLNIPLMNGARSVRASYRAIRKDGRVVWMETSGERADDGTIVTVTRDVTERKLFEISLEQANAKLEVFSNQDALTGLANRRRFDDALEREFRRARREHDLLALLLVDVDHFKAYNDAWGHPAGDGCLRAIADAINTGARRPTDVAARYGGEEMALILPNTDLDGAVAVAERIRGAVEDLRIPHPTSATGTVTVSVGVAVVAPAPGDDTPRPLIERADRALYSAKAGGRNAVHIAAGPERVESG